MDLPYLERVKIHSEILLPLFRLLRSELGEEKASNLLRAAVREYAEALGRRAGAAASGTPLHKLACMLPMFAAGDALEIEPLRENEHELSLNVRRCEYARYFQELGEVAFGKMLTCEIDPTLTAAIDPGLTLDRTQTIMEGADHCDFRWRQR